MKIAQLQNQIQKELAQLGKECRWDEFQCCLCGDKVLYGPHIGVRFYYDEDEPIRATFELRRKVTRIFRKYYSSTANFFKARHSYDAAFAPPRSMLVITLLI